MSTTASRPVLRPLALLLSLLLAITGLTLPALAANAAPGDVAAATLQWGIKASFRSYLTGPIAHGHWIASGVADATPFGWSGGSGAAAAGTGTVSYPGSLQFQGHQGFGVGTDEYALDLTFSDVAVRVTGATTAELVLDARSRGLSDPATFVELNDVVVATLDLSGGTDASTDGVVAYSGVPATLTADGAAAFAGFYSAGTALDPVSFSWPVEAAPDPEPVVPTVTVSDTTDLHSGDVVTVTGTGFGPGEDGGPLGARPPLAGRFSGVYVVFGTFLDDWRPSEGAPSSARKAGPNATRWVMNPEDVATVGGAAAGAVAIAADGSFEVQLTVTEDFAGALAAGTYGIYTYPGSGATYAPFETSTPVTFAAAATTTELAATPSGPILEGSAVTLTATVTAGVAGTVRFTDGTTALGEVAVAAGTAQLTVTPGIGDHAFRAEFTPTDVTAHASSLSAVVALAVAAPVPAAGSLSWGVKASFRSYVLGDIAHGTITSAGGASPVSGGYLFPQSSATVDRAGLGTVSYRGSVTFTGHAGALDLRIADPIVRVTSAAAGVLSVATSGGRVDLARIDLGRALRTTGTGGAVTYTGAPTTLTAAGAASFAGFYAAGEELDPLTFTVGSDNPVDGAGSVASNPSPALRSPAAAPPATEGITAGRSEAFVEGGEYTFTATGFGPNETGILVVAYSTPTVLATDATADSAGVVTWTGRLPAGLTGEHTLTFQGSVARGIVIRIAPADAVGCAVDGAELSWGFKESFRAYIDGSIANGEWTTADGATYATPRFAWAAGAGGYDAATGDADLAFAGAVRFTGHGGALETTIANPRVVIDGDRAVLLLDVTGTTQSGEAVAQTGVEFADLDLAAAEPGGGGDLVAFSAIPARLTAAGAAAFGTYPEGEVLDPVDLRITVDSACAVAAVEEARPLAATETMSGRAPAWPWIAGTIVLLALIAIAAAVLVRRARSAA